MTPTQSHSAHEEGSPNVAKVIADGASHFHADKKRYTSLQHIKHPHFRNIKEKKKEKKGRTKLNMKVKVNKKSNDTQKTNESGKLVGVVGGGGDVLSPTTAVLFFCRHVDILYPPW